MTEDVDARPAESLLDRATLDHFLCFGYDARVDEADPWSLLGGWSPEDGLVARAEPEPELVREGARAFRAAMAECAALASHGGQQVVLLSGGLDSRALLGGLLELFDSSEILTLTYGMPGEQDYEFARRVARRAGVRHETLQTSSVDWTTQGLVDSILARAATPLPFAFGQRYLSYCLHRKVGGGSVFWDGLMGDAISGGFLRPHSEGMDWETALAGFVRRNTVRGAELVVRPGFRPGASLPTSPLAPKQALPYVDQLAFSLRQTRYISTRLMAGHENRTPFLRRPWVDFILSVPVHLRLHQRLYLQVLEQMSPDLFSLPGTHSNGVPASAPAWRHRQRDLERRVARRAPRLTRFLPGQAVLTSCTGAHDAIAESLRHDDGTRRLVEENIEDLQARGLLGWVDVSALWQEHLSGRADHRAVLRVLVSLEVNLKAMEELQLQARITGPASGSPPRCP